MRLPRFKIHLYALALILGASLFPITPQVASAASPTCANVGDYTIALQADSRYVAGTTAFIVFMRDWTGPYWNGQPALAVDWDGAANGPQVQVTGYDQASARYTIYLGGSGYASHYTINSDGSLSEVYISGSGIGPADINCISVYHTPDYEANGHNPNFGNIPAENYPNGAVTDPDTGTIDGPPSEPCDWYDLVCVAQKIYLSVKEFGAGILGAIGDLSLSIVTPIVEALVPGEDKNTIFSDFFNSFNSYMTAKLGFLLYPFQWFGQFFNNIFAASWTGGYAPSCVYGSQGLGEWGHCTLGFEVWQGQSLHIDFGAMEKHLPAVWNVSVLFARFAFFIAIIEMLRRAYFRTVTK